MTFDPAGFFNAGATLVTALPGMQQVKKGVPEGFDNNVVALVAMTNIEKYDKTVGQHQFREHLLVVLGVRVKNNEESAELTLLGLLPPFVDAWKNDRTIAGTVQSSELDMTVASNPDYGLMLGQEYRIYPIMLVGIQYDTYPSTSP